MRLDFVKTDIEAAEIEAIEGAGSVLSVFKPQFAIVFISQTQRVADSQ
jgi:hypothetical protein